MKKRFAALLILCLFLPAFCSAEEPFSLRNGYAWGMSMEAAQTLAAQEGIAEGREPRLGEHLAALYYADAPVGAYTADEFCLEFFIPDGEPAQLSKCTYYFPKFDAKTGEAKSMLDDLTKALTDLYGTRSKRNFDLRSEDQSLHMKTYWEVGDTIIYAGFVYDGESDEASGKLLEIETSGCFLLYYSSSLYQKMLQPEPTPSPTPSPTPVPTPTPTPTPTKLPGQYYGL